MSPLKTIHLHRIFRNLDKNGDGLVSIDELMWLPERIGVQCRRDELELLINDKALNTLDFLFFYETLAIEGNKFHNEKYNIKGEDETLENDLKRAFRVFDLNGDGFISSEELRIVLSRFGLWEEQDCDHMIGVYDTNKDGLLDFEEFKDMMCACFSETS